MYKLTDHCQSAGTFMLKLFFLSAVEVSKSVFWADGGQKKSVTVPH